MNWLRRVGLAYRLRAIVLLVAFAIGSLLARDALLVHEAIVLQAELQRDSLADTLEPGPLADLPAFEEPPAKLKIRPSGISRRSAMNPLDPPADDDETDEDSDTVGASYLSIAILAPPRSDFFESPYVTAYTRPESAVARPQREERRPVSSRGPPV